MKYFTIRNVLFVSLFVVSLSPCTHATEVYDENWDPLSEISQKTSRKLNSKNNSPCKITPKSSPEKKGTTSSVQPLTIRKICFENISDDPDECQSDTFFNKALNLSRQSNQVKSEKTKSSYVCALPDAGSAACIESALVSTLQEEVESSTIDEILKKRTKCTVLNLSATDWPTEKHYHMSLDSKKTKDIDEETKIRLQALLSQVEFGFSKIEMMQRFIAIKLSEPCAKDHCSLSEEDMQFLKQYLQYGTSEPCMHISLIKVNSLKEEMQCIPPQKGELDILVPDEYFAHQIEALENSKTGFSFKDVKRMLSKFYLSYLFVTSKDTRDYIASVHLNNKDDLYPTIYASATYLLNNLPHMQELAQTYFRKNYNIDPDFDGKIVLQFNGWTSRSFDEDALNHLFSEMFLLNDAMSRESFNNFQKLIRFYIDRTLYRINQREDECMRGVVVIDPDALLSSINLDMDSFFDAEPEELSVEQKKSYEKQNEFDRSKIRDLRRELSLHFIMNRFFGLSWNQASFDEFYKTHQGLIGKIDTYMAGTERYDLDSILLELDKIIPGLVKNNFLDPSYVIDETFNLLDTFNRNFVPFILFFEKAEQEIKEEIFVVKNKEIERLNEEKGNAYEKVFFSNSKIPNPIFWHKFWHILEKRLPSLLQGTKFSFEKLNDQPIDEENEVS